jgi:hypothetical protein
MCITIIWYDEAIALNSRALPKMVFSFTAWATREPRTQKKAALSGAAFLVV